jgi:hypothetical protein
MLQNLNKLNELVSTVTAATAPEPSAPQPQDFLEAVSAQLTSMSKHLKDDEDLALFAVVGPERLRVFDVEFTAPDMAILHGIDPETNRTTALVHIGAAQFICKVVKMKAPVRRRPVGFHLTAKR